MIVFVADKKNLPRVERMFQVGVRFVPRAMQAIARSSTCSSRACCADSPSADLLPLGDLGLLDDGAQRAFAWSLGIDAPVPRFLLWLATLPNAASCAARRVPAWSRWIGRCFPRSTLPLLLTIERLSFTDAYFETVSGLTASGATVLAGLDRLPPSINVWRGLMIWLGGMGVIVLAVAILPLLGVGGCQLFKAETPAPMKDTQLTPRIAETAKGALARLRRLYAGLHPRVLARRNDWIDALMHGFTTMGLGGFSSHDASWPLGFAGDRGGGDRLHADRRASISPPTSSPGAGRRLRLPRDPEAKAMLLVLALACCVVRVPRPDRRVPRLRAPALRYARSTSCRSPPPRAMPTPTTASGRSSRRS